MSTAEAFDVPDEFLDYQSGGLYVVVTACKVSPDGKRGKVHQALYRMEEGGGIEVERLKIVNGAVCAALRVSIAVAEKGWRSVETQGDPTSGEGSPL